MSNHTEIRWHGRGGQGAKTASLLLADAAASVADAKQKLMDALESGRGLERLRAMITAQGGDPAVIDDPSGFPAAAYEHDVVCMQDGWLYATDTEKIGIAAVLLGAGRETKESVIDPAAGIRLLKKAGDPVKKGDVLARLYAGDAAKFAAAEEKFHSALTFAARRPQLPALVLARVDKDGVTRF